MDKFFDRVLVSAENDTSNDVSLTLHSADDGSFEPVVTAPAGAAFLVPMAVLIFAADVSFIDLDNAAKLVAGSMTARADFVAHAPSGFVGTETHVALDLEGAKFPFC